MSLQAWFGVLILVAALAYIPLSVLAATGSRRRAWAALRESGLVMGVFASFGLLGLIAAVVEYGPDAIVTLLTIR